MTLKNCTRIVFALALCCTSLFGQTVAGSLVGTVVDSADAAVANAPVTLTSVDTGWTRTGITDNKGTFRFQNIELGRYSVTVEASGFKTETQIGIVVTAQETRIAGKMILQTGVASDLVSVVSEASPLQLASTGKNSTIDAGYMNDITLKGRDLFGYLRLVPGVIDTNPGRDVTSPNTLAGISIDGNTSALNFTVDGITDMDSASNQAVHFEPNLDAIQEIKVLSANYQAEFGRNSGGIVTVVTKNGTQDFHGTATWNHRNEEFDANSWANNHTVTSGAAAQRVPYRYNVETYSIGGPTYLEGMPKWFKNRVFFFFSQERTGQFVSGGSEYMYTPTALELTGDFSASLNNNGTLLKITDPATGQQFPGNVIPASRLNTVGVAALSFFPSPNFTPTLPAQLNVVNYFEQSSSQHPRLDTALRVDGFITPKIRGYFRWIADRDSTTQLFDGVPFASDAGGVLGAAGGISPILQANPGHGYSASAIYTITPTLINEITVGQSRNVLTDQTNDSWASESRTVDVPGIASLFPLPAVSATNESLNGYQNLLPSLTFGSSPANAMYYTRNAASAGNYQSSNTTWIYQDNLSKTLGHHALKAGAYFETNNKIAPAGLNYEGSYSFASSTANPLVNTGDGYVNALLGNVNSYTQYTGTTTADVEYYNLEFYLQDNWKVSRRLTVDYGIRFYHQTPPVDHNDTFVNFVPSQYSASAVSRVYAPYCADGATTCSGTDLVGRDPLLGATVGGAYIGDLVLGSGNPASGMVNLGVNGASGNLYHQTALAFGPRVGFAYDLMGDGKTAIRGGWGLYYNRLDGSQVYGLSGQEPLVYQQTVSYVTLPQIAALNTGAVPSLSNLIAGPNAPTAWPGSVPYSGVGNGSLDVQRNIGKNYSVDVGYTLNYSYRQPLTYDMNWIPLGSDWPFTKSNVNPTTGNSTLPAIFERTLYPGLNNITGLAFIGRSNYNALTASVKKRLSHGVSFGAAYAFSKALGTTTYTPNVPNNNEWNYGRLSTDRRHNLQVSYMYDLPNPGRKVSFRVLGVNVIDALIDRWQLSGIASFQSGAPYNPTCSVASGPTPDYSGTPDIPGTRCQAVGNPMSGTGSSGNGKVYFNAAAYALPALATGPNNSIAGPPVLGNLGGGAGALSLPHVTNLDVTLTKNIPLFGSERILLRLQAQAYNVFNHTEISGVNSNILFSPNTGAISNASSLGYANSTLPNRVLGFGARLQF